MPVLKGPQIIFIIRFNHNLSTYPTGTAQVYRKEILSLLPIHCLLQLKAVDFLFMTC